MKGVITVVPLRNKLANGILFDILHQTGLSKEELRQHIFISAKFILLILCISFLLEPMHFHSFSSSFDFAE